MVKNLRPEDVVRLAAENKTPVALSTLATLRSRDPGRLPFKKIFGKIYYDRAVVERALGIDSSEER